jgi:hypothetical protein
MRAGHFTVAARDYCRALATVSLLAATVALAANDKAPPDFAADYEAKVKPVLETHCFRCHNSEKKEGGLSLAQLTTGKEALAFDAWPKVAQRFLNREMPPEGEPQPNQERWQNSVRWMHKVIASVENCETLSTDVTESFYHGHVMSRRLTRSEYNNTIRDLIGLDLKPADDFPADGAGGEGFDTVGDALFTNPILMEKYLAAANRVIETALPDDDKLAAATPEVLAARKQILIATPVGDEARETEDALSPRDAARKVLESFIHRAYRRPAAAEDVDPLLALFDRGQQRGDSYVKSLRLALKGALVSANFLFLVEPEPGADGIYELGSVPLASRLSYFLWGSLPDDELSALAESDQLKETDILRAQAQRMLADPRSQRFAQEFATQWLDIDNLGRGVRPDPKRFPDFDDELAAAMKAEATTFVGYVFREDRSLLEMLDADYTFVNERLAKHYGIPDVVGQDFRRVELNDRNRGGLLSMACVLTANSYPLRTSPVLRGKWLLAGILGDKVPPPPPNVPSLPTDDKPTDGMTLRQRLEQHREKAECASCHNRMDPLGFGLENFDPTGRWRTEIADQPVDASGELPNGKKFAGPAELKHVLLERKQDFLRNLTRKVLCYALGRDLGRYDECVVRDSLKGLEASGYRSSIMFEQIVLSYPFRHRYAKK